MKQTPVEWLLMTMSNHLSHEQQMQFEGLFQQAMEMESPLTKFITNDEFMKLMEISKRTAQNWRDEGVIAFSQVGHKIYYRLSDIEDLLNRTYKNKKRQ